MNLDLPRILVGAVCAYEALAIFTSRSPTVSHFCWKHRILIPMLIAGLTAHLIYPPAVALDKLDRFS